MSTMICRQSPGTCLEEDYLMEDDVRSHVRDVLGSLYPRGNRIERRMERRYPYPYLVHLTPVGDNGAATEGEALVVVGKHLSEEGLGFYHPKPIPNRRMIALLETDSGSRLSFLIDLTWCRFTKQGWYESGGRFLQASVSSDE